MPPPEVLLKIAEAERARRNLLSSAPEGEEERGFVEQGSRVLGEINEGLMTAFMFPQGAKDKLHELGVGSVDPIEGPVGKGLQYLGMASPFAAATPLAVVTNPMKSVGIFRSILDDIGRYAVNAPKTFLAGEGASAFGAGVMSEVAKQEGVGGGGQMLAEVGGSLLGAPVTMLPRGAQATRQAAIKHFAPMTQEGGMIRSSQQTQRRAGGQEEAFAQSLNDVPEGVTPAQWIGDERLMAQEAAILRDNPELEARVRGELGEARLAAQEELLGVFGSPRSKQDWERAVLNRVTPTGVMIEPGMHDDMLNQAYNSFKPFYEVAKGHQIDVPTISYDQPLRMTAGGNLAESPQLSEPAFTRRLVNSVKSEDIIADPNSRNSVAGWVANQSKEFEAEIVDGALDSDHFLNLRSRIRDERRRQTRNGNAERADLLGAAEGEITRMLEDGLPSNVVEILRRTDGQYRTYKIVEDAIFSAGDNALTSADLSRAIQSGGLTSQSRYARGVDEVTQDLRKLSLSGRSTSEILEDPRGATHFVRDLTDVEKQAVHADFVDVLYNRAISSEATDSGIPFVSGEKLIKDLKANEATMRALGMGDADIERMTAMAQSILKMGKKSPSAVANIFEDGPATVLQLAATLIGARSGQNMAGGGMGSSLVLAQFMSNRARGILANMTSDEATKLMTDAATDPKLYKAMLTKSIVERGVKDRASYLESWLMASAFNRREEENGREIQ